MINQSKKNRQEELAQQRVLAELRKTASLSLGLFRSDAALEKFREEWFAIEGTGQSLEEIAGSQITAVAKVRGNAVTRAMSLLNFHLAALYAVVEKWKEWKFSDPAVDKLLDTEFVTILRRYRHEYSMLKSTMTKRSWT